MTLFSLQSPKPTGNIEIGDANKMSAKHENKLPASNAERILRMPQNALNLTKVCPLCSSVHGDRRIKSRFFPCA